MSATSRLPLLRRVDLNDDGKELYDYIVSTIVPQYGQLVPLEHDGNLTGLPATLLHTPLVGKLYLELINAINAAATNTSPKAKEVALNVIVANREADYAMHAHHRIGRHVGITNEQLDAIYRGERPKGLNEEENVVWEVARGLKAKGPLEEAVWERAVRVLGKDEMIALVHLLGFYEYTSTILNGFRVTPQKESGE